MRRVYLLQLAVLAAVSGTAYFPQASLLRAMSLVELTKTADRIVVGHVRSMSAAWDPEHRKIFSTIEIDVDESWKGTASEKLLTIVQPGGSVGEIEMSVQGMPSFVVGEKIVLFLQGQSRFRVTGMSQGKRALDWNETAKQWLVQSPDSEGVVEVGPGAKLRQAKRQTSIPLSDLREQVLHVIGKSP